MCSISPSGYLLTSYCKISSLFVIGICGGRLAFLRKWFIRECDVSHLEWICILGVWGYLSLCILNKEDCVQMNPADLARCITTDNCAPFARRVPYTSSCRWCLVDISAISSWCFNLMKPLDMWNWVGQVCFGLCRSRLCLACRRWCSVRRRKLRVWLLCCCCDLWARLPQLRLVRWASNSSRFVTTIYPRGSKLWGPWVQEWLTCSWDIRFHYLCNLQGLVEPLSESFGLDMTDKSCGRSLAYVECICSSSSYWDRWDIPLLMKYLLL